MPSIRPTLHLERRLLRSGARRVAGVDEVGRGSPAGPLYVGLVVVDATNGAPPSGIRDSKLLSPRARELLAPRIRRWASAWSIGVADPTEVDRLGLTGALRLAGARAVAGVTGPLDHVVVDGNFDWISAYDDGRGHRPVVTTRIKADLKCTSVAAASILAKVARDAVMVDLAGEYPAYGWAANKGYATSDHLEALRRLGPTPHHRLTWRLPERV